jgi:hypothetical protein
MTARSNDEAWAEALHRALDERDAARARLSKLDAVAVAARNVVAQWRGDISRKPHIGKLREALVALDASESNGPDTEGSNG